MKKRQARLVNHLRQHRARVGITQEQLADAVGVKRQTIISMEKARYVPSTLLAFLVADVLKMSVADLFELEEVKTSYEE